MKTNETVIRDLRDAADYFRRLADAITVTAKSEAFSGHEEALTYFLQAFYKRRADFLEIAADDLENFLRQETASRTTDSTTESQSR